MPFAEASVHLYWQCHNRLQLLRGFDAKKILFNSLIHGLSVRNLDSAIQLHAFCLMDNHVHQQVSYKSGVQRLSRFMRLVNGKFGRNYNDKHGRSGAVLNSRPKTPVIQDELQSQMRVHFYIEANPIRARIKTVQNLRTYFWNSYRLYAFGEIDQYTRYLTPPSWYLQLANTAAERQRKYRELFENYLKEVKLISFNPISRFIGGQNWSETQNERLRSWLRTHHTGRGKVGSPPPKPSWPLSPSPQHLVTDP